MNAASEFVAAAALLLSQADFDSKMCQQIGALRTRSCCEPVLSGQGTPQQTSYPWSRHDRVRPFVAG